MAQTDTIGSGYMVGDEPVLSEHQAVWIPDSHCGALKTGSEGQQPITYCLTTTRQLWKVIHEKWYDVCISALHEPGLLH